MFESKVRSTKRLLGAVGRQLRGQVFSRLLEQDIEFRCQMVSPADIRQAIRNPYPLWPNPKTLSGDWDNSVDEIERLDIYESLVGAIQQNRKWSETPLFQRAMLQIDSGTPYKDCATKEELMALLEGYELMYQEFKEVGYLPKQNYDQISIAIGRHGDLILNSGKHRLCIARLAGLSEVPCMIIARHTDWVQFKKKILLFLLKQSNRKIYAPILHPDLQNIPSIHGHKRFELMWRNVKHRTGTLLDIGSHWGYFSHRFERKGFQCTAIEIDPENYEFLMKLRRACNRHFEVVHGSIFDYVEQRKPEFDVVLALAVFHHFVKTPELMEKLKKLLSTLKMKEMFFLPHKKSDPQMNHVHWNPSETEFVDFILQHTSLNTANRIGYATDGRPLYHLT